MTLSLQICETVPQFQKFPFHFFRLTWPSFLSIFDFIDYLTQQKCWTTNTTIVQTQVDFHRPMAAPDFFFFFFFFFVGCIEGTKCVSEGAKIKKKIWKWLIFAIFPFWRGEWGKSLRRRWANAPMPTTSLVLPLPQTSRNRLVNIVEQHIWFDMTSFFIYRGKLGDGEHLSLEAYKYKKYNIYVVIIMQHKEHIKFYPETHFYWHNFRKLKKTASFTITRLPEVIANAFSNMGV